MTYTPLFQLRLIRRIFIVSMKFLDLIPGFNCFITTFPLIFRVSKKVTNELIIFKLRCNDFLIRRVFLTLFFLVPSVNYITICFSNIVFKKVLDIGRKMKFRYNLLKKCSYILTTTMVFRNDCIKT